MLVCVVALKSDFGSVATPPESIAVPREVTPSKNSTVPVGVPAGEGVTVAVRLTVVPKHEGSGAITSDVVLVPPVLTFRIPAPVNAAFLCVALEVVLPHVPAA